MTVRLVRPRLDPPPRHPRTRITSGAMTIRTLIFWLHLIAGVVAGIVVLIMSRHRRAADLREADARLGRRARRGRRRRRPTRRGCRRDAARRRASAAAGGGTRAVTLRADPRRAGRRSRSGRERHAAASNAYTGAVLGEGAPGLRAFFRSVTDWHRWLAATGDEPRHRQGDHRRLQPRFLVPGRDRRLPLAAAGTGRGRSFATSRWFRARAAAARRATSTGTT